MIHLVKPDGPSSPSAVAIVDTERKAKELEALGYTRVDKSEAAKVMMENQAKVMFED